MSRIVLLLLVPIAASLVIVIQPIATLSMLPSTGGHPTLWHAGQVLFQSCVLVGYLAAWILLHPRRKNTDAYSVFMIICLASLFTTPVGQGPSAVTSSPLRAIGAIALSTGPLVVGLASLSVGTQLVLMRLGADTPAWVYALSNAGSLAGIVAFPFAIEPVVDLDVQALSWRWVAAVVLLAAALVLRGLTAVGPIDSSVAVDGCGSTKRLLMWLLGGAGPVSLSLATTTYLSLEVGAQPVAWLGPFSAYLGTMLLAYTATGLSILRPAASWADAGIVLLLTELIFGRGPLPAVLTYAIHMAALFTVLARWQVWLAATRPVGFGVVSYYCAITVGGIVGGVGSAFLVPAVFNSSLVAGTGDLVGRVLFRSAVPEYLCLLALSGFVRPHRPGMRGRTVFLRYLGCIGLGGVCSILLVNEESRITFEPWAAAVAIGSFAIAIREVVRTTPQLAVVAVSTSVLGLFVTSAPEIVRERVRTAFGQIEVREANGMRLLVHGSTTHGNQEITCADGTSAESCTAPRSYYAIGGPLSRAVAEVQRQSSAVTIGVVGLGVGTVAAYCRGSDAVTFFEIDSKVVSVAERWFRYLETGRRECRSSQTIIGDARVSLRQQPDAHFDILVVDAFSSDAVPSHLLTKEAVVEFRRVTGPTGGVIAFHVSNRYFDLASMAAASAVAAGLGALPVRDPGFGGRREPTVWVFVGNETTIGQLRDVMFTTDGTTPGLQPLSVRRIAPWTDQRHSLLELLK